MKKVLSFVLVLSMVLGSFGMAFAAAPSDVVGEDCETAVTVLMDLGVVEGYKDGSYQPEGIVTRAEMATLIVKALGLNGSATGTSTFTDMGNAKWAEGYVAYASSLGVVSGYGNGTFGPNNTVTYDQATTMIVQALGYTADCLNGTYPGAYVSKAKTLGILDDVSGSGAEGANRGDVAIMLYNALDQAIGKVNKDGDWVAQAISFNNKGEADEFDTMLSRLDAEVLVPGEHGLEVIDEEDDNAFILDETWAEDAVVNVYPYVGHVVSAYINDDEEIIGIKEVFSTALTGDFNSDGDEFEATIGDFDVDFEDDDDDFAIFYNGAEASSSDIFKNADGEIRPGTTTLGGIIAMDETAFTLVADVSGQKIKDVYAVHIWEATENAIVDEDDISDIFNNSKLLGIDLPENDDNELDLNVVEFVGVTGYEDIKDGDVVYVYAEKGESSNEATRIAVGRQTVTGTVSRLERDGGYADEVRVNGTTYNFTSMELANNGLADLTDGISYESSDLADIETGDSMVMTLDAYGYVYDFEAEGDGAEDYAVVLKWEDEEEGKISSNAKLKLLLADGSVATYAADDDEDNDFVEAKILNKENGVMVWDESRITAGAIIKYGLNSSNEIDSIEALTSDDDYDVFFDDEDDVTSKGYWNGKKISKNAAIFSLDGDITDEDDYTILTQERLCGSDDVKAKRYIIDDNEIVAMLLDDDFSSGSEVWALFESFAENDSDAGAEMELWVDGSIKVYDADDDEFDYDTTDKLGTDLYMVEFDADGAVSEMTSFVKEADEDEDYTIVSASGIAADHMDLDGDTFEVIKGDVFFSYYNSDDDKTTESALTLDSDVLIMVMNDDGDWEKGSKSDLRNLSNGDVIYFYDTVDADKVYDIVVIIEK